MGYVYNCVSYLTQCLQDHSFIFLSVLCAYFLLHFLDLCSFVIYFAVWTTVRPETVGVTCEAADQCKETFVKAASDANNYFDRYCE